MELRRLRDNAKYHTLTASVLNDMISHISHEGVASVLT